MSGPYFPGYVVKGDVSDITSDARHELGRLTFDKGRILQYVKFGSGSARYQWVGLDTSASAGSDAAYTVSLLINTSSHSPIGVAEYGGTASSYGWITRFGGATAATDVYTPRGTALVKSGAVTGILRTAGNETFMAAARGFGLTVSASNTTGHAHINVNCL